LNCGDPVADRGPKRVARAKFCSNACKFAYQRAVNIENGTGRLTKTCEVCATPFTYYRSVRPNAAFCSLSCRSIVHSGKLKGRIQEVFKDRATFTKSMRRFLPSECAICGWGEASCDVCHIIARKAGGPDLLENVVMLCPNHHRMFDCGLIPVEDVRQARATWLLGAAAH